MQSKHNRKLILPARALRKNMTKEERHLWYDFLRDYPIRFYRQKVLGKYITDFYCAQAKLVVELDGSQHYEQAALEQDAQRTAFLQRYDIAVIRVPNSEIPRNFEGVCTHIDQTVRERMAFLDTKGSPVQGELTGRRAD